MIQNILSVVGGIVLLSGILLALALWFKAKIDAKLGPILKVIENQTGFDLPDFGKATPKDGVSNQTNPRLQALEDAEALLRHFEAEKNTAGQTALQSVVQALFTKPQ